jgi:hypothetical protein
LRAQALRAFDPEVWVQPKLEATQAAAARAATAAALSAAALAQRASSALSAAALRAESAAQVLFRTQQQQLQPKAPPRGGRLRSSAAGVGAAWAPFTVETAFEATLASSLASSAAALGRTFWQTLGRANSQARALDGALARCKSATAHRQQAEATVAAAHLLRTAAAQQRDAARAQEVTYVAERVIQQPRRDVLAAALAARQCAFNNLGG